MMDIYKLVGEDALIQKGDSWMPLTEGYCKEYDAKFEKDLLYGKLGEEFTRQLIEDDVKFEIKTERDIWKTTGNIVIEIRCKGKPSGISTTQSEIWIQYLSLKGVIVGGFILKVDLLKDKIKNLQKQGNLKMVMGGDFNASQMALLPIKELFS